MVKIMVLGHRGVYISDDLAANSQDGIPPLSIAISIIEKSNAEQGSVMDFAGLEQQEADAINHLLVSDSIAFYKLSSVLAEERIRKPIRTS